MSKVNLDSVAGGYNLSNIASNFDKIKTELNDKVLYRNNPTGEPNSMGNDLDMNGKRVYNLPAPTLPSEAARLQDVKDATAGYWDTLIGKPDTFPPSLHNHNISDVNNLNTVLSGKQETLASGVNIKTVNGVSLVGPGDISTSDTISTLTGVTVTDNLTFNAVTPPAYVLGRLFYDSAANTLNYYNDNSQMSVNIGQEQIIRVRNQTGSTIVNGTAVYISGATGQTPLITKAIATSFAASNLIGVTTTDISNNGFGYVTVNGIVNGINTSAYADGAILFVSDTTAGAFTTTEPTNPNYSVQVGVVAYSHAVNGKLLVAPKNVSVEVGHIVGLAAGASTFLSTPSSANLKALVTDETGSGSLVFATSPTLVTPALGTPSSAVLTNATGLPISTGVSGLGTGIATVLATPSSANLASAITDETGSGKLVFATSPTLTTPIVNGLTGDTSAWNIGSGQIVKDTAGNVGLGVTPSAWGSTYVATQIGLGANVFGRNNVYRQVGIGCNFYYDSAGAKYLASSQAASMYQQDSGSHYFYSAPPGTAGGAVSFIQAMTLDAYGQVGVGTTPKAWNADFRSIDVGINSSFYGRVTSPGYTGMSANAYRDNITGAWKYISNITAGRLELDSGYLAYYSAGVGTAGNTITFSNPFTITPSGNTEHTNYTKLGTGYTSGNDYHPAIKTKVIKGTTASTQGGYVNITHGVTDAKIIAVLAGVDTGSGNYIAPCTTSVVAAGYEYEVYGNAAGAIAVQNSAANSSAILSKAIKITIMYEE